MFSFKSTKNEKTREKSILVINDLPPIKERNQENVTLQDLQTRKVSYKFPTTDNLIENILENKKFPNAREEIVAFANGTRPIMDCQIIKLIENFLTYKLAYGTKKEKILYKDMSIAEFIDRLLTKRPLTFYDSADQYKTKNNETGFGGFENIGSEKETFPLLIKDYLTYDELQISALIGVSTPTYFINNGARNNSGKASKEMDHELQGIFIGQVGARFEKPEYMEWQHMVITRKQNTSDNGYGRKADVNNPKKKKLAYFAKFYGQGGLSNPHFPSFEEAQQASQKYLKINEETYLNIAVFKKRMRLIIVPFLLEANERARALNKKAHVRCVGLGLGPWMIDPKQEKLLVEVYNEVLQDYKLDKIAALEFCWFKETKQLGTVKDGEKFQENGNDITIYFSKGNIADKLPDPAHLLVAQYSWDGGSYTGNEYWVRKLGASGDPAAASCSLLPQLQNPDINLKVNGHNITLYGEKSIQPEHIIDFAERQFQNSIDLQNEILQELDKYEIKFLETRKKPKLDNLDRLTTCQVILSKLQDFNNKLQNSNNKQVWLLEEMKKWQEREKTANDASALPIKMPFRHLGVRTQVAALISIMLLDGNSVENARKPQKIPYIELEKNGMEIHFPKYEQRFGNYGKRFYDALQNNGYQDLDYQEEVFYNEYGHYVECIRIKDHKEIFRLVSTTCCLGVQAACDMYRAAKLKDLFEREKNIITHNQPPVTNTPKDLALVEEKEQSNFPTQPRPLSNFFTGESQESKFAQEVKSAYPYAAILKIVSLLNTEFRIALGKLQDKEDEDNYLFSLDKVSTIIAQVYIRLLIDKFASRRSNPNTSTRDALQDYAIANFNDEIYNLIHKHLLTLYEDPQQISRYLTPQDSGKNPIALKFKLDISQYISSNSDTVTKILSDVENEPNKVEIELTNHHAIAHLDQMDLDKYLLEIKKQINSIQISGDAGLKSERTHKLSC